MELDNNAHSVFLLYYHLVLVVKYRRQVFDETVSERSKEIFVYIAPKYNIMLQEWNYDKDHVQILFRAHPNSEISKFINAYKSASSRLLKKDHKAAADEKIILEDTAETVERMFLEPEFLPAYNRRRTNRSHQKIY